MKYSTTKLDSIPVCDLVGNMSEIVRSVEPNVIYMPHRGDVHSDHRVVFDAAFACSKWFRFQSVKRILSYEALSETDFGVPIAGCAFLPNVYVDVSEHLERKIGILKVYESEIGAFPFPRSFEAVRALAALRGAAAGCVAAEAFMLLKEIA
jgi:N-acetylglucosamine malate deacetylase 1